MNDHIIDHYRTTWSLQPDGTAFETPSSWLQPVRRGGNAAMLKVLKPDSDEQASARLLEYYDGEGAVALLAGDEKALLLERAEGKRSLPDMALAGCDMEAAKILAATAARLMAPRPRPAPSSLRPLGEHFRALFEQEREHPQFGCCAAVVRRLLATGQHNVPLHGDLHHANVLDGGARGWLAIDPKALLGDPAYDFANLLRNPAPHRDLVFDRARMQRLGHFYADRANLDPQRVIDFAFAHAGLSAAWDIEDGLDPTFSLGCVETLAPLSGG